MPHADAASLPAEIESKAEFWYHVHEQLAILLDGQRDWITNLANTSSLMYSSLLAFPAFGDGPSAVNWCGFYVDSNLFPTPSRTSIRATPLPTGATRMLLGPFCGKPACQFINTTPGKGRGVCADAYTSRETVLVPDVHAYPGHIACDGGTNSEIVAPLVLPDGSAIGVLDLDCLAKKGFDEDDRVGVERIAKLVVEACDW
ncbi:GAF domain-like protein [Peniophora sp. CONT]|nr:GAF domain-like protein [Peniophora sp. CONT]